MTPSQGAAPKFSWRRSSLKLKVVAKEQHDRCCQFDPIHNLTS